MSRTKQGGRKGKAGAVPRAVMVAKNEQRVQQTPQKVESDLSEHEDTIIAAKSSSPDTHVDVLMDAGDSDRGDTNTLQQVKNTKSKRNRDDFESDNRPAPSSAKKRKYKSKAERKAAAVAHLDVDESVAGDNFDPAIAQMDPALLADHVAKTVKRFYKNDTALELEERYLLSSIFKDTTSVTENRRKQMLGTYLEVVVAGDKSKLMSPTKDKASPHTIVLCSSGIRGADVGRVLRTFETDGNKVAKLFAKHFKLEQQAVFLRKTAVGFGVCTPDRIKKLIETQALKIDRLARIVIDGSYLDEKRRGFWNMVEVFRPMLELLKMDEIQERIQDGGLEVMVF